MKSENEIMVNEIDFFEDLFNFSDQNPVDVKKTSIASDFCSLLYHVEMSRSELADKLNWKKSRISKVLNGNENLTIKTMVELSQAMGYDFDINFHLAEIHRCLQPWEQNLLDLDDENSVSNSNKYHFSNLQLQSAMEVFNDISKGKQKDLYWSLSLPIEQEEDDFESIGYSNVTFKIEENSKQKDLEDFSFITNTFIAQTKKVKSHG